MIRGPILSPVSSLCFVSDPSQNGNYLGPSAASSVHSFICQIFHVKSMYYLDVVFLDERVYPRFVVMIFKVFCKLDNQLQLSQQQWSVLKSIQLVCWTSYSRHCPLPGCAFTHSKVQPRIVWQATVHGIARGGHDIALSFSLSFLLDIENSRLTCFFFKKFIYFIFDCAGSSLLCVGFPSCREQGPLLTVVCGLLTAVASLVADHRLGVHRFGSCGTWAQWLRSRALERWLSGCGIQASLLRGTCSLPGSGIRPMCPGFVRCL